MLSQIDLEQEILRLSALAEKVTTEIARRAVAAAQADSDYKKAHASAFLMAQGKTVGDRESQAALESADEFTQKRITEAHLLGAQEAGRNYRAQLDALRSINANFRALVSA